jgi:coenzyme PQQ precursor peptide PqqA
MRAPGRAPTLEPAWKPEHTGSGSKNARIPWPAFPPLEEATVMKWETPKAFDTRFGFEITMYISTR